MKSLSTVNPIFLVPDEGEKLRFNMVPDSEWIEDIEPVSYNYLI
jgi:hypothetical protein